jgi:hypothetical protein
LLFSRSKRSLAHVKRRTKRETRNSDTRKRKRRRQMKRAMRWGAPAVLMMSTALFLLAVPAGVQAQGQGSGRADRGFVDRNGDGVNDNARDADGDGIPNGQDPDYERMNPMRGNGQMGFVDEDGDGINDRCLDEDGDGIPNGRDPDYVPPMDGTGRKFRHGHGRGGPGAGGGCDGTGPKGGGARSSGRG